MYQQKGGSYIGDGDPGHKLSCRDAPRFSPFSAESRFSPTSKTYSHSSPPKAECCKMQTCWLIAGIRMTAGCWAFMQTRAQIRQRHQPWIAILQLIMHLTLPFTTLKSSSRYCNVDSTKILREKKTCKDCCCTVQWEPCPNISHSPRWLSSLGFLCWALRMAQCQPTFSSKFSSSKETCLLKKTNGHPRTLGPRPPKSLSWKIWFIFVSACDPTPPLGFLSTSEYLSQQSWHLISVM